MNKFLTEMWEYIYSVNNNLKNVDMTTFTKKLEYYEGQIDLLDEIIDNLMKITSKHIK